MEDERAGCLRRVEPRDHRAPVDARGVAVGGEDDRHGCAGSVAQLRATEIPARGSGERLEQVALEQREDRLGLGIAEPAVELEHLRAFGGQHEPGVEQPDERRATALELREDGSVNARHELRSRIGFSTPRAGA